MPSVMRALRRPKSAGGARNIKSRLKPRPRARRAMVSMAATVRATKKPPHAALGMCARPRFATTTTRAPAEAPPKRPDAFSTPSFAARQDSRLGAPPSKLPRPRRSRSARPQTCAYLDRRRWERRAPPRRVGRTSSKPSRGPYLMPTPPCLVSRWTFSPKRRWKRSVLLIGASNRRATCSKTSRTSESPINTRRETRRRARHRNASTPSKWPSGPDRVQKRHGSSGAPTAAASASGPAAASSNWTQKPPSKSDAHAGGGSRLDASAGPTWNAVGARGIFETESHATEPRGSLHLTRGAHRASTPPR
mmetsp:Transcript_34191/g.119553  ORF Transcript_34191/g.119553 Transcript_34191/m.119553 type:complete len:306 (-) Transcript_34191:800-1717(-)